MSRRILIAGASRGIGREFVRQCSSSGWIVHATARDDAGLKQLDSCCDTTHRLDITNDDSVAGLTAELSGVAIDVVLVNAGISGDQNLPADEVTFHEMFRVFETNTYGPLRLIRALKANLMLANQPLALAMSSLMSSISSNNWGTQHSYRASKTALNAIWRSLHEEWIADGICCALLRPGFVKTDMTDHQGLDVEVSVAGMMTVIEGLTLSDGGRLIGYDGVDVPW